MDMMGQGTTPEEIAAYLRRANKPNLPQRARDMAAGAAALPYRLAGTPVDLATMAMRPFGYSTPDKDIVGSSEHLLAKAQGAGLHPGVPQNAQGLFGDLAGQVLTPGAGPTEAKLAASVLGGGAILDAGNMTARTVSAYSAPAAMRVPRGQQGIFAGFTAAKDAPMDALALAERMAKERGLDQLARQSPEWMALNREIHAATGDALGPEKAVHFGLDGLPRYEIDDSMSTTGRRVLGTGPEGTMPRTEALAHSLLDAAYPETRDLPVKLGAAPGPNKVSGQYNPQTGRIDANAAPNARREVLLHELQHDVQKREGFDGGAAPQSFPQHAFSPDDAEADYYGNIGEMEARATEVRRELPSSDRAARFPLDDYRAPRADAAWGPGAKKIYPVPDQLTAGWKPRVVMSPDYPAQPPELRRAILRAQMRKQGLLD